MKSRRFARNFMMFVALFAVPRLGAQTAAGAGQTQGENQGTGRGEVQPLQTEQDIAAGSGFPGREARVPVPLPLNIDASSLEFSTESAHTNFIQGGVSVGAAYDDNLLSQFTAPVSGFNYTVMPSISLNVSRPRLLWTLNYAGGYVVYPRFSSYNQGTHNAGVDVRYRLSPHVNLRVTDHFIVTSNFFDQLQGNSNTLGGGVIQGPNRAVITPLAHHTDNLGSAEVTYQYSASDMVGASGSFFDSRFQKPPGTTLTLQHTRNEEGDGFYTHRITPRNWSGVAYKFQRLTFNPATEEALIHSFLAFHTIYLQPKMTLAVFAGAEYADLNSQVFSTTVTLPVVKVTSSPVSRQNWSTSAGVTYLWQGERLSVEASGLRKLSDGGGVLSAVELLGGRGAVRRQVTRSSAVELGLSYGDSRALESSATSTGRLKSASGNLAWQQRLGRNFSATVGYAREYQQQISTTTPPVNAKLNHNRGWVSLGYEFTKPLGR